MSSCKIHSSPSVPACTPKCWRRNNINNGITEIFGTVIIIFLDKVRECFVHSQECSCETSSCETNSSFTRIKIYAKDYWIKCHEKKHKYLIISWKFQLHAKRFFWTSKLIWIFMYYIYTRVSIDHIYQVYYLDINCSCKVHAVRLLQGIRHTCQSTKCCGWSVECWQTCGQFAVQHKKCKTIRPQPVVN